MIKKINIDQLKPGMFVVDVTNSWSRFMKTDKKLFVANEGFIKKLKQNGVREIVIDTAKSQKSSSKNKKTTKGVKNQINLQQELKNTATLRKEIFSTFELIMTDFLKGEKINVDGIQNMVSKVVDSVFQNRYIIAGLGLLQSNNNYLFDHSVNSLALMVAFANSLGYDQKMQNEMGVGALLHDIGMLKIPSKILNKKGRFTEIENKEMMKHVEYGYKILKNVPKISNTALLMAIQHHERINGTGYPLKLKADKISNSGQMIGIVDVYLAATTDKGYKKGISPSKALANILVKGKKEFEKDLVAKFIQAIGIYPFGTILVVAE